MMEAKNMRISLTAKILAVIVITLLITAPISQWINLSLKQFFPGSYGVYITTAANLLLVPAFVYIFLKLIVLKPLFQVIEATKEIGKGNLHTEITTKTTDEIGELISAIHTMKEQLNKMVFDISTSSTQVENESNGLSIISNEVSAVGEQISETMQQLAAAAEEQASASQQMAASIEVLQEEIKTLSRKGEELSRSSDVINSKAAEGQTQIDQTRNQMEYIYQSVAQSVHKVANLEKETKGIFSIVKEIKRISDQTNLLALNASIEAARAGEHGRGFAVVANEVQKLAYEVARSLNEITDILKVIENETNNVVNMLNENYQLAMNGHQEMQKTQTLFKDITEEIKKGNRYIKDITDSLVAVSNSTSQIHTNVDHVASIAQENAASIEEVTSSTQEQQLHLQNVARSTENLKNIVRGLNETIQQFKL
jgi:methyl-accepting chemotaxis protein